MGSIVANTAATTANLGFDPAVTITAAVALSRSRLRQGSIRVRRSRCERNQEDREVGCGGDEGESEGVGFDGEVKMRTE